jgi:phospholipase/carboxylesterase
VNDRLEPETNPGEDPHAATETLRAGPPLGEAAGAVVLLHGRKSTAQEILQVGIDLQLPGLSLVAPAAADDAWYPRWYTSPLEQNQPWLDSALRRVDRLVDECRAAGLGREQIGLLGFSQGTCLALEYLVRNPTRISRVVALSGALMGPADEPRPAALLAGTRVLVAFGGGDPYFPTDRILDAVTYLSDHGARISLRIYKAAGHTLTQAGLAEASSFLGELLRPVSA